MPAYLTQGLHRALQRDRNRTATTFGDRRRSFAGYVERVARLASALQALGALPGTRIGMLALNSDRYQEYFMGCWWGGCIVNPCNTRWSAAEVAFSLIDSDTRFLIVDDQFASLAGELKERARCLETIIYAGDGDTPVGMLSYESLIENAQPVPDLRRGGKEIAAIFYTGGTSGFPKGVALSHDNLHAAATSITAESGSAQDPVYLHAAPMFHLADASWVVIQTLRCGSHVIIPSFDPPKVMKAIEEERVTSMLLVPTMLQMLLDHPDVGKFDMSSLRFIHYGGSPMNEATLRRTVAAFPDVNIIQGYGLTEALSVSMLTSQWHVLDGPRAGKLRSAGRPTPCAEIRIVDPQGQDVGAGSVGEITVRGPMVMEYYWGKPELTAEAIRDGWLHTGDGGYFDDEGFLFIVDRIKEMIVSGGENVYSAEVENALMQHDAIEMCAVIGVPDEKWGERVHAVVVLKSDSLTPGTDELISHCRALIANYKSPRSFEFRDKMPLSGAGKILKSELRAPHWKDAGRKVN